MLIQVVEVVTLPTEKNNRIFISWTKIDDDVQFLLILPEIQLSGHFAVVVVCGSELYCIILKDISNI